MLKRSMSNAGPVQWDPENPDHVQRIQGYINVYLNDHEYQGFEALLMRTIKVLSAKVTESATDSMEAEAVFELEAVPGLCNPMGNMHGGAMATLIDMATTMATAPIAQKGFWEFGGVSRTLTVTYLKPVTKGTIVEVKCMLRSIGKRLSVTQCLVTAQHSGTLLALGQHDKSALIQQTGGGKRDSQL